MVIINYVFESFRFEIAATFKCPNRISPRLFCFLIFTILFLRIFSEITGFVILLPRYILSIEKPEEIEEYVGDLLQGTDGKKGQFIDELLSRWQKTQRQASDTANFVLLRDSVSPIGRWINAWRVLTWIAKNCFPGWKEQTKCNKLTETWGSIWEKHLSYLSFEKVLFLLSHLYKTWQKIPRRSLNAKGVTNRKWWLWAELNLSQTWLKLQSIWWGWAHTGIVLFYSWQFRNSWVFDTILN